MLTYVPAECHHPNARVCNHAHRMCACVLQKVTKVRFAAVATPCSRHISIHYSVSYSELREKTLLKKLSLWEAHEDGWTNPVAEEKKNNIPTVCTLLHNEWADSELCTGTHNPSVLS